jgi:hypothetical protein
MVRFFRAAEASSCSIPSVIFPTQGRRRLMQHSRRLSEPKYSGFGGPQAPPPATNKGLRDKGTAAFALSGVPLCVVALCYLAQRTSDVGDGRIGERDFVQTQNQVKHGREIARLITEVSIEAPD